MRKRTLLINVRRNSTAKLFLALLCMFRFAFADAQGTDPYTQRFLDLRDKLYNPANGYFSPDGVPYHSAETLICEAPDYGHETTSEMYSYWIWLEAMYGRVTSDWTPLNSAWTKLESFAIPTQAMQPTANNYNPSAPATYAAEHPLPSGYPSALETGVPVGQDPVSAELTATYGNSYVYGMHWLFDLDNFYGYGNMGDGVSTPSYINTFQRGEQESVWETVPHPSWESFQWGSDAGTGYLKLFIDDPQPAQQWRYTDAPDADARAVQAIYWATQFAKDQGLNPATTLPLAKAKKMGDYLRLALFDKYFKPMGVQNKNAPGATGYASAHYLLSWYYAWGGPIQNQNWAWRIGCSHNHFGYQNPVAAYALSSVTELIPNSPNAARDWNTSLGRQLEFYQWLQSAEGAIAGGATNSWNGNYETYPAGQATFYGMAYDDHPVYHDPGSNTWFGWQAWSMERVAEYYYITNDARAKTVLDKWIAWVKTQVQLSGGTYSIPSELSWTGQPNTWVPGSPAANTNLHVNIVSTTQDAGIAACLSKALIYYAAGTQRWATLDTESRDLAKEILDRMWTNYYEPGGRGVGVPESRGDFHRFFDQEVFVPEGWTGHMPNGDVIESGVKFIDIRSQYRNDPDWARLEAAYNAGQDYVATYHRFWAQVDVALANAEYARFFVEDQNTNHAPVAHITTDVTSGQAPLMVMFDGSTSVDADGDTLTFTWNFGDNTTGAGVTIDHTYTTAGSYTVTLTVSDGVLSGSATATITVSEEGGNTAPVAAISATPDSGDAPLVVSFSASGSTDAEGDPLTYAWDFGDGSTGTGLTVTHTYAGAGTYTASVTVSDGELSGGAATTITVNELNGNPCDNPVSISLPFQQNGAGEFCFVTSGNISYINSWNMSLFEINGVNFTNVWSNSMPARINGNYYIHYVATVAWAHAEVNGTGGDNNPQQFTLTTATTGPGTVTLNPAGGTYDEGTQVTLTATPGSGFQFSNWSGGASGTTNPLTITLNADVSVTANFTEIVNTQQFTLTTSVTGTGTVSLNPAGGVYDEGTVVTVTATPGADFTFAGWSGDASGTTNPISITMNSDQSVTATFESSNTGTPCTNPSSITLPFAQNGVGDFCFVTSGNISYVNSWNMSLVEINGVDYTNTWSNSMPARIDGNYYIHYVGAFGWSHFEAAGSQNSARIASGAEQPSNDAAVLVYPNPSRHNFTVMTNDGGKLEGVEVYDKLGRKLAEESEQSSSLTFGDALVEGMYFVKVRYGSRSVIRKVLKE